MILRVQNDSGCRSKPIHNRSSMKPSLLSVLILTSAALSLSPSAKAQVQAQIAEVKDTRTTGEFFAELEVKFKLLGNAVADAQSIRVQVKTAVDDTGRDLLDPRKMENQFARNERVDGQSRGLSLKFKNPSRKAATIRELTGEADLFVPKNDPNCVLIVNNFQKLGG